MSRPGKLVECSPGSHNPRRILHKLVLIGKKQGVTPWVCRPALSDNKNWMRSSQGKHTILRECMARAHCAVDSTTNAHKNPAMKIQLHHHHCCTHSLLQHNKKYKQTDNDNIIHIVQKEPLANTPCMEKWTETNSKLQVCKSYPIKYYLWMDYWHCDAIFCNNLI